MKNVLIYLPAFYLLVPTNFASKVASKPSTGSQLIKTNSGKYFALLSKKKHDAVGDRGKRRKGNEKTVDAVNRRYGKPVVILSDLN